MMQMRGKVPADQQKEFRAEMQKRMQSMTPQERQQYRGPQNGTKCNGQGMGQKRMAQMPMFADFDVDGNGVISETEWQEGQAKRMQERAEEGRMMKNAGNAPSFADIDTDKDGKVTPAEFQQHQMQQRGTPKNGMKCSGQGMGQGMQKKCNTAN